MMKRKERVYEVERRDVVLRKVGLTLIAWAFFCVVASIPVLDKADIMSPPGERYFAVMGKEAHDDASQWFIAVLIAASFVAIASYKALGYIYPILTNPLAIRARGSGAIEFEMPFCRKTVIPAGSIETIYLVEGAFRIKHSSGTMHVQLALTNHSVREEEFIQYLTLLNPAIRVWKRRE
jgi:hypothetical protein